MIDVKMIFSLKNHIKLKTVLFPIFVNLYSYKSLHLGFKREKQAIRQYFMFAV